MTKHFIFYRQQRRDNVRHLVSRASLHARNSLVILFVLGAFVSSETVRAQSTTASNNLTGNEYLGSANGFDVLFKSSGFERMRLLSSGQFGIGTATPTEALQVDNGIIKVTGANHEGGPMFIFGGTPAVAPNGEWGIEYTTAVAGREGLNFWKPFGSTGTGGNDFLFLSNSGRVGINTDNPTAQLTVNGNMVIGDPSVVCIPNSNYKLFVQTGILTEKLRVAINCSASWSDYVFQKSYRADKLDDVERYIEKNKHLPDIPSADEVVKNGVDVGEMTSKLLAKVEELTLYAIEQNKKIEKLQKKISKLEAH
jgi:hypothetical protein